MLSLTDGLCTSFVMPDLQVVPQISKGVGLCIDVLSQARRSASRRVVVKRPRYAPPLREKPDLIYDGKLVRYDIYLKKEEGHEERQ